jgi:biotin operon repressor
MNQGWIKLHRSLLDWEWYDDVNVKMLFLHCVLKANHTEKQWRGVTINRGQFYTSLDTLSKELGLSIQKIRTAISKLESTGEITSKQHAKARMVTVINYDNHQADNKQVTSNQQGSNKEVTTTKNEENEENEENENNKKAYYNEEEGLVVPSLFKDKMIQTYSRLNVAKEIREMDGWLLANPRKRKKDYERFINGWLKRHNDDLPSSGGQPIPF